MNLQTQKYYQNIGLLPGGQPFAPELTPTQVNTPTQGSGAEAAFGFFKVIGLLIILIISAPFIFCGTLMFGGMFLGQIIGMAGFYIAGIIGVILVIWLGVALFKGSKKK